MQRNSYLSRNNLQVKLQLRLMLRIILLVLLWGCSLTVSFAQIEDYYRPQKRGNTPYLINRPDIVRANNHWYVGLEGGGKWNGAALSSGLSGLLSYRKGVTNGYYAAQLGYSHNLRWTIETGYIRNPSTIILAVNSSRPFPFRIDDYQHSIPFRFKWRVFRLGNVQKQSGMYVGGGFVWTPTRKRKDLDGFQLSGLSRVSRTQFDTLIVENNTFVTGKAKVELEGSIEFVGRLSPHFEILGYGRVSYAAASALESKTELFVNNLSQSISVATLRPVTYQFGMAIRYLYGLKNNYRSRFEE